MSELQNGNFWGLLTDPRYTKNLSVIVDFAEEGKGTAGFFVERHKESNRLEVAPVVLPTDKEAEDCRYGVIREKSWGNVGVLVTAHSRQTGVPNTQDLKDFADLSAENPKPIRGWAVPLPLGGSATLFVRESNTRLFIPDALDGLDEAKYFAEAAPILVGAGLNCFIRGGFQVPAAYSDDKKLFA